MKRILTESALVCAFALVILVLPLGKAPFSSRGEAREAVVVLNMLEQNNFILPLRNGVDIPSKPPLFHWASASASILSGSPSEFAIRLPSALAAALTITATYFFGAVIFGRWEGLFGALILATCAEFARTGTLARVDMVFTLFLTVGTFLLFIWALAWEDTRAVRWGVLFTASFALVCAVLAKGPAGFVIPWAIVGTYLLLRLRLRELPVFSVVCAVTVTISLAGIWYFLAYREGGQAFLEVHLMRENVARVMGLKSYATGHKSPFFLTPLLLISGMFPWSLFSPPVGILLWEQVRSWKRDSPLTVEGRFLQFALIWILVLLAVFTIASSKRSVYLMPCYPAAALLLSFSGLRLMAGDEIARRSIAFSATCLKVCGGIFVGALIALFGAGIWGEQLVHLKQLAGARELLQLLLLMISSIWWLPLLILMVSAAFVAAGRALRERRIGMSFLLVGLSVLALVFSTHAVIYPPIAELNSPRLFIREVNKIVPQETRLYALGGEFYPAMFYGRKPIFEMPDIPEIAPGSELFVLVIQSKLDQVLQEHPESVVLGISDNKAGFGKDKLALVKIR